MVGQEEPFRRDTCACSPAEKEPRHASEMERGKLQLSVEVERKRTASTRYKLDQSA